MTRRTYRQIAVDLAEKKGVELTDEETGVELWGYPSHMSWDVHTHTSIPQRQDFASEAEFWQIIIQDLKEFGPCAEDCICYTDMKGES